MAKDLPLSPISHSSFLFQSSHDYNNSDETQKTYSRSDTACTYFTPLAAIHAILVPLATL